MKLGRVSSVPVLLIGAVFVVVIIFRLVALGWFPTNFRELFGLVIERQMAFSRSSDKSAWVSVRRTMYIPPVNDYTLAITVKSREIKKDIVFPQDRQPYRPEVYWGPKSVGILVCDFETKNAERNINLTDGKDLAFEEVRDGLNAQIVRKYQPTVSELGRFNGNIIEWYCGDVDNQRLPTPET